MEYSNLDAFLHQEPKPTPFIVENNNVGHCTTNLKVEALLHRVLHTMEKHEGTMCQLNKNCIQLGYDVKKINDKILDIFQKIDHTEKRIDSVEQSIKVDCCSSNLNTTVGQLVISNRRALVNTLNILSNKVDSEDLKESMEAQNILLDKALKELRRDLASNDSLQKTHETINSIIARMDVIHNALQSKVDKTLYKALSSKAAAVQNYADFVTITESSIQDIKESISKYTITSKSYHNQLQEIATSLTEFTTKVELKELEYNLNGISGEVEQLKALFEHTKLIHDEGLSLVQDNTKTLFVSHETLAKYISRQIENIYDKSHIDKALSQMVTRDSLDSAVTKISTEIELKASLSSLYQLQQSLARIEEETKAIKRKAELSAQFISLLDGENSTC